MVAIDRITSIVNRGCVVDVPTGVGFCMFIRRECYLEVGELDVATFNRGYGEENDFCVRASLAGWRNVAATDVFVRHTGEVSFALDAATQQKSGYMALLRKHPTYEGMVRKFVARDLLRSARQRLDIERLLFSLKQREVVLFVTHSQGGGIETHLTQLSRLLSDSGIGVLLLCPSRTNPFEFAVNLLDNPLHLPNLSNLRRSELLELVRSRLLARGPCAIHLHSAVGFDLKELALLLKEIKSSGVRVVSTLHDYSAICPRHQLVDDSDDYCGIPSESVCNLCAKSYAYNGKDGRETDVKAYKQLYRNILELADRIYVPSTDTRDRLQAHLPGLRIEVRRHIEPALTGQVPRRPLEDDATETPIRVVIIGAIGPHKGSSVVFACAADAAQRALPISFHVIGYTNIDERLKGAGVSISGPFYSREQLKANLEEIGPHLAFFSSIWPETYLYTLSSAFSFGIFPVAFDIGAQAERIKEAQWGALIDIEERFNPKFINDSLVSVGQQIRRSDALPEPMQFAAADDIVRYYGYSFTRGKRGALKQMQGA